MKITRNLGMLLLAVWLILMGLVPLFNFSFSGLGTVMAILAIASGILIVLGR
jgi:hypothetical protein